MQKYSAPAVKNYNWVTRILFYITPRLIHWPLFQVVKALVYFFSLFGFPTLKRKKEKLMIEDYNKWEIVSSNLFEIYNKPALLSPEEKELQEKHEKRNIPNFKEILNNVDLNDFESEEQMIIEQLKGLNNNDLKKSLEEIKEGGKGAVEIELVKKLETLYPS